MSDTPPLSSRSIFYSPSITAIVTGLCLGGFVITWPSATAAIALIMVFVVMWSGFTGHGREVRLSPHGALQLVLHDRVTDERPLDSVLQVGRSQLAVPQIVFDDGTRWPLEHGQDRAGVALVQAIRASIAPRGSVQLSSDQLTLTVPEHLLRFPNAEIGTHTLFQRTWTTATLIRGHDLPSAVVPATTSHRVTRILLGLLRWALVPGLSVAVLMGSRQLDVPTDVGLGIATLLALLWFYPPLTSWLDRLAYGVSVQGRGAHDALLLRFRSAASAQAVSEKCHVKRS